MNFTLQNNVRLLARNEGKIKSYESCCDVRAWSHDVNRQDRYLREWMKCDMPICVIPVSTLAGFLTTMTCRSRRRAMPRCHPDCKSKVLLESICTSCHAVRKCLKHNENLDKYFVEEELESSHWPCDRCLEALKSIKMFWKIIIDKIFNINVSKLNSSEANCEARDSVRSVTKVWQAEMVQQSLLVQNITPALDKASNFLRSFSPRRDSKKESQRTVRSCPDKDKNNSKCLSKKTSLIIKCEHSKAGDSNRSHNKRSSYKKISRSTSIKIQVNDVGCETCFSEEEKEGVKNHKNNLSVLRQKYNEKYQEVERLKRENNSLRIELGNVYKYCPWKASFSSSDGMDSHKMTIVPKPFEENLDESSQTKDIDSEMIITMKNCKNESFRHVSLLQVLHKTNSQFPKKSNKNRPCCTNEDPIELLTKVQNTFGAIVRREMTIANDKRHWPKKTDVEATFQRLLKPSISVPSCATSCSRCSQLSSEGDFVSEKKDCNKNEIRVTNI